PVGHALEIAVHEEEEPRPGGEHEQALGRLEHRDGPDADRGAPGAEAGGDRRRRRLALHSVPSASARARITEAPIATASTAMITPSETPVGTCTHALPTILAPTKSRISATPGFRYTNLSMVPARTKKSARSPSTAKMF